MSLLREASRIATAVVFAAALAACGGGGGGSKKSTPTTPPTNPPDPPTTPTTPTTPPPLLTADPVTGFTFEFGRYWQSTAMNELPKVYEKVAAGDFNGDGREDLVAILQLNELQVFLQRADGTFAEPWVFATQINYSWRKMLYVADFDNDGADDILFDYVKDSFGSFGMGLVMWQRSPEPGLALRELPSVLAYGSGGPNAILPLDFNGDGNVDIIEIHGWKNAGVNEGNCIPNDTCPHIVLYPGDGRGHVGAPRYSPWPGVPDIDDRDFFIQDIDMDGRDDVVFMSLFGYPQQTKLYAMKRRADGGLENPVLLVDMGGVDSPASFGDLNNDGRMDVIYGAMVHFRDTSGVFQAPVQLGLRYYMESYWNVLGDFDGNGQTDIVNHQFETYGKIPYFATYLQRNGTVQAPFFLYDPPTDHTVNPDKWGRQAFATGDFNSDGCRDIAVAIGYDGILFLKGRNCIRPAS